MKRICIIALTVFCVIPAVGRIRSKDICTVEFLGDTIRAEWPASIRIRLESIDRTRYGDCMRTMAQGRYRQAVERIESFRRERRLCDWGVYMLVKRLSENIYPPSMPDERTATQIFLLGRLGYDVRAAISGDRLAMLLCCDGTIYEQGYIDIGQQRYYIFEYGGSDGSGPYRPISEANGGRPLSLEIGCGVDSPADTEVCPARWSEYLGRSVSIPVSTRRIELMRSYPSVDRSVFYKAEVPTSVRDAVLPDLRQAIENMTRTEATEYLLHLVQHGFEYADDRWSEGDRQLSVEESLYYGRNNCKDRVLVFTWLVGELLGLDTIRLHYQVEYKEPDIGHVAAGVAFDEEVAGTYVEYRGRKYVVCDPTYVDAHIGEAMPRYATCRIVPFDL